MTDAKDLSKIDFSKCELPEWRRNRLSATVVAEGVHVVSTDYCGKRDIVASKVTMFTGTARAAWLYNTRNHFVTADDFRGIESATMAVDAFITSELARLAAEEEAANFVPVPWQDVEWLQSKGQAIQFRNVDLGYDWWPRNGKANHLNEYRADRRTFPTGYDPGKPRWVEVGKQDAVRLRGLGVSAIIDEPVARIKSMATGDVVAKVPGAKLFTIDIHTLPPGVPLHVEQEKPQWRPCSKEFALAHAGTSQVSCSSPTLGFMWREVRESDGRGSCECCQFQTTSPEPKPEPSVRKCVPSAFMMRLIGSLEPIFAKTKHGPWAAGRWFLFDAVDGFKSGAAKDACTVNLDMHLFFAQEWFEVEQ